MKKLFRILGFILVVVLAWALWHTLSHGKEGEIAEGQRVIRVLTYNTHRMGEFKHVKNNAVIQFLQNVDADVLCLQEAEVYKSAEFLTLPELRNAMIKTYPYTYYDFKIYNQRRQFGNVVFSKYPLINKHTIPYQSRSSISSCCDMIVGEDTLRLFINHLESNRFEKEDLMVPDSLSREVLHQKASKIAQKLESAGPIRMQQARAVHKAIKESPYPSIVVGDFNCTPLSYTYHCIQRGLQDCFLSTSCGRWGTTFAQHHLGLRIDYILCSKELTPVRTEIPHIDASDHYPVIATIGL